MRIYAILIIIIICLISLWQNALNPKPYYKATENTFIYSYIIKEQYEKTN
jgi:hypothetical protein